MMNSSLKERLARLGPIQVVDQVSSGSPATFVLRLPSGSQPPRTVDIILALVRRGMTMLRAKRAVEALLEDGSCYVHLPVLENADTLVGELYVAGVSAANVEPSKAPDVRDLREGLGLTREQFAVRYGFEVETLRNWETGKREPDMTAKSYLRVIANDPERVQHAYAPTVEFYRNTLDQAFGTKNRSQLLQGTSVGSHSAPMWGSELSFSSKTAQVILWSTANYTPSNIPEEKLKLPSPGSV